MDRKRSGAITLALVGIIASGCNREVPSTDTQALPFREAAAAADELIAGTAMTTPLEEVHLDECPFGDVLKIAEMTDLALPHPTHGASLQRDYEGQQRVNCGIAASDAGATFSVITGSSLDTWSASDGVRWSDPVRRFEGEIRSGTEEGDSCLSVWSPQKMPSLVVLLSYTNLASKPDASTCGNALSTVIPTMLNTLGNSN